MGTVNAACFGGTVGVVLGGVGAVPISGVCVLAALANARFNPEADNTVHYALAVATPFLFITISCYVMVVICTVMEIATRRF